MDQLIKTRLFDSEIDEELLTFFWLKLRNLFFDASTDDDDFCAFFCCELTDETNVLIAVCICDFIFADVCDVEHWFHRQQLEVFDDGCLIFIQFSETCWFLIFEQRLHDFKCFKLSRCVFIARLDLFLDTLNPFFDLLKICEDQFEVDRLDIIDR